MPGCFSPEEQEDLALLDQSMWDEVDPVLSDTSLDVSNFSPFFSSFPHFAVGHCRIHIPGFATSSLPLLSPKSQLSCPICLPAAEPQMVL